MSKQGITVRALSEIAIRCVDHSAMVVFYRDVIGLEPMHDPHDAPIVFFRIADEFEGHTAVPALFRHDIEGAGRSRAGDRPPATGPRSSLHHIALGLPRKEQDAVIAWYEKLGLEGSRLDRSNSHVVEGPNCDGRETTVKQTCVSCIRTARVSH